MQYHQKNYAFDVSEIYLHYMVTSRKNKGYYILSILNFGFSFLTLNRKSMETNRTGSRRVASSVSSVSYVSQKVDPQAMIDHSVKLQNWICAKALRSVQVKIDFYNHESIIEQMVNFYEYIFSPFFFLEQS